MEISQLVATQRAWFEKGDTLPVNFRLASLRRLRRAIKEAEPRILAALRQDLNKSPGESYLAEVGMVLGEVDYAIRHLPAWAKARAVPTPLAHFPAVSRIYPGPYGVALIMAPWNYPFLLTMDAVVGAVAAGCCAVVKPSAYAPATSEVIGQVLQAAFRPQHVATVQGGRAENAALLEERFDVIFFTGSVSVGKLVMEKASAHLTPVILELGGKSPCIVDETADIPLAARRIAFGKLLNAGQTCVAPDYVLVHRRVQKKLEQELARQFQKMAGPRPLENPDWPRIVNQKHFDRLLGLLKNEQPLWGGAAQTDERGGSIEPTLLRATPASACMQEEIFGPILPILPFEEFGEAVDFVAARPHPLALYLFTQSAPRQARVMQRLAFGGGCVNDTIIHLASHHLGFGGVGQSGMGGYHGKRSFDAFTHEKGVIQRGKLDLPMRYAPYTPIKDKLIRLFLK